MSASMTAPEQIDGLEKLLALANLKPENIIATQKAAREQLQLTQEEQGKVAEARAYIAKHTSLVAELKGREDAFVASKEAHIKDVADFKSYVATETTRLNDLFTKLGIQKTQQEDTDNRHAKEAQQLASDRAEHQRQIREFATSNATQVSTNNVAAQANATEKERLTQWEATLKRKAELARQQMANF